MATSKAAPVGPVFADAPIPKVTRTAAPNPFAEVVAALVPDSGAKVVTIALGDSSEKQMVARVRRQLQEAGHAAGKSVRSVFDVQGQNVTVTFWTVPRIVKGVKGA